MAQRVPSSKVETYIGVNGQAEGKPQLPDGKFLPVMKMTCGELIFRCCPFPTCL